MKEIVYVRLTQDEYSEPDGTRRNDKLRDRLRGENRDIQRLELRQTEHYCAWIAHLDDEAGDQGEDDDDGRTRDPGAALRRDRP